VIGCSTPLHTQTSALTLFVLAYHKPPFLPYTT
jgi:hypothetical protein